MAIPRPRWALNYPHVVVDTPFLETWRESIVIQGLVHQAEKEGNQEEHGIFLDALAYLTQKGQAQLLGIEVPK